MATPLVSVIIPAYNAGSFLTRAIQSAQIQTHKNIEILIIDDMSTDNTVEVAKQLAKTDPRIHVFQQPKNGGPSAARNRGLQEAKGEWVAILDADDAYTPERLSQLLKAAEETNADVIADNIRLFDFHAGKESGIAFKWGSPKHIPLTLEYLLKNDTVGRGNPLGWTQPMIKSDFLKTNKIIYQSHLRHAEDFYFYIEILLKKAKAFLLNEPHYIYTTRVGAISGKSSGQSQTKTDISSLAHACDSILAAFKDHLSPTEIALFQQRKHDCYRHQNVLNLRHYIATKKCGKAAIVALRHPQAVIRVARGYAGAILRRLK